MWKLPLQTHHMIQAKEPVLAGTKELTNYTFKIMGGDNTGIALSIIQQRCALCGKIKKQLVQQGKSHFGNKQQAQTQASRLSILAIPKRKQEQQFTSLNLSVSSLFIRHTQQRMNMSQKAKAHHQSF